MGKMSEGWGEGVSRDGCSDIDMRFIPSTR
jgi:hypothetical protein